MLFCIVFEHMAGGIGSPVKATLVYYFHELNKAQKENQKVDFLSRLAGKGRTVCGLHMNVVKLPF